MTESTTAHGIDHRIRETDREKLDEGEHVELDLGKLTLFVTVSRDTTAIVLADEHEQRQSSIVVDEDVWVTR